MRIVSYWRTNRRLRNYIAERLRFLTARKIVNAAKIEWARMRRARIVHAYPYEVIIDPTNICQLRCPLCPTGSRQSQTPRGRMDLTTFSRAIDILAPYALHVYLHNWGESLLHPDILDFILYAKRKKVLVTEHESAIP
jgi:MoaA/NifB/PqqE/SkfB family radical SAM enzyme